MTNQLSVFFSLSWSSSTSVRHFIMLSWISSLKRELHLMIVVDSPTTTRPTWQENIMVDKPKLKEQHPLIVFVPCAGHSLNLVGNLKSLLFSLALYSAYILSLRALLIVGRFWRLRLIVPGLVVKRLIDTRRDAVHALFEGYNEIKEALSKLAEKIITILSFACW